MSRRDFQGEFLRRAGRNVEILRQAAEDLPGVNFNIVDNDDRIVAFNRSNCENCNFKSEAEIVGRRIEDAFPSAFAEAYVSLYREVRETGKPVRNRIVAYGADHSTTLRRVSVFPIRDDRGAIIGTTAFYRPLTGDGALEHGYESVKAAVAHIDRHFGEKITLRRLAALSGMSETTFQRAFRKVLGMSVGAYITTIRLNQARKLLVTTSKTLADIAAETGFYDESHFIHSFKKLRHQTPAQYRRSHFG